METANQVRSWRFANIAVTNAFPRHFYIFLLILQVLSVLSGSPVFSISSYSSHVAREREEAPRQLLHCGVTPTFEKVENLSQLH